MDKAVHEDQGIGQQGRDRLAGALEVAGKPFRNEAARQCDESLRWRSLKRGREVAPPIDWKQTHRAALTQCDPENATFRDEAMELQAIIASLKLAGLDQSLSGPPESFPH